MDIVGTESMWIWDISANGRSLRDQSVGNLSVRVHDAWSVVLGVANVTTDWTSDLDGLVWISQSGSLQLSASVTTEEEDCSLVNPLFIILIKL